MAEQEAVVLPVAEQRNQSARACDISISYEPITDDSLCFALPPGQDVHRRDEIEVQQAQLPRDFRSTIHATVGRSTTGTTPIEATIVVSTRVAPATSSETAQTMRESTSEPTKESVGER
ncbi:hypothetical protein BC567DRAFT_210917 [Phyllosticta citribraziliensis]